MLSTLLRTLSRKKYQLNYTTRLDVATSNINVNSDLAIPGTDLFTDENDRADLPDSY
jgi:hypothetical protein